MTRTVTPALDARGRLRGSRWRGQIPVPPYAHPLVRELIGRLNEEQTLLSEAAERAGVSVKTVSDWRYRITPTVVTLDAVARTVGYRLALVPVDAPAPDSREPRRPVGRTRAAVLAEIEAAIREGRAAPTNAALARRLGVSRVWVVGCIAALERAGEIRVERYAMARRITLPATGAATATPRCTVPHWSTRQEARP